jgi:MoaA/NifB/PqqE/SkfB family radical SAM enzyme
MGMTWGELGNDLIEKAKEKGLPIAGQFELTARCNLQCKMCYVCSPANDRVAMESELTSKEWISLAKQARDAGMLYLLLTGGEVFLRQDFREIYEAVSNMGFNIIIYTNATMITPEIAKWLGRIPPSRVEVTLYGASEETYKSVCGNPEAFKYAKRGIDLLLNEGISLEMRTTIIRRNIQDFDELRKFAQDRGINLGLVNYISPRREGINTYPEMERLSAEEQTKFDLYAERCFNENKNDFDDKKEENERLIKVNNNHIEKEGESTNNAFNCGAGKYTFWIKWNGAMTPCGSIDQPEVFPLKKEFKDAWIEMQHLCNSVPICVQCKQCELYQYCPSCPARLKNETGFYDKSSSYLCALAKENYKLKAEMNMVIL